MRNSGEHGAADTTAEGGRRAQDATFYRGRISSSRAVAEHSARRAALVVAGSRTAVTSRARGHRSSTHLSAHRSTLYVSGAVVSDGASLRPASGFGRRFSVDPGARLPTCRGGMVGTCIWRGGQ